MVNASMSQKHKKRFKLFNKLIQSRKIVFIQVRRQQRTPRQRAWLHVNHAASAYCGWLSIHINLKTKIKKFRFFDLFFNKFAY